MERMVQTRVKETESGDERQSKYRHQQNQLQDEINFATNIQSTGINSKTRPASLNTVVLF